MTRKTLASAIAATLLGLALGAPALAKEINPADYPLTAKLLSYVENANTTLAPEMGSSTGGIPGGISVNGRGDREEVLIGDTIYVTSLSGGGQLDGKVGYTFPAQVVRKSHVTLIYLLCTDKHGKAKAVGLEVTSQRVKK